MTARAYVLIFFFWAILTIITPTLIFLSENSKLSFAPDSSSEKRAEIKTRKMMGHSEEHSITTLIAALVKMQVVAAPAPSPAPALETSVGIHKQDVIMYKEIVAQMLLFEV